MVIQHKITDLLLKVVGIFVGKVSGIALPELIIVRSDIGPSSSQWYRVVKHEEKHVEQWRRYWYLGFSFLYVYQYIHYGYRDMPLEIEARNASNE